MASQHPHAKRPHPAARARRVAAATSAAATVGLTAWFALAAATTPETAADDSNTTTAQVTGTEQTINASAQPATVSSAPDTASHGS